MHLIDLPRTSRAVALAVIATITFSACGGGGSTAPATMYRYIPGDGTQIGWIRSGGSAPSITFVANPIVGDLDSTIHAPAGFRAVYGFSLATVPAGAHITLATLKISVCGSVGSPITKLGDAIVDHIMFAVPFDSTAYAGGTLAPDIGALATDLLGHPGAVDATASVASDVAAGRPYSQYRVRMANLDSNNDGHDDILYFTTDAAHSGLCPYLAAQAPQLIVAFTQ